MSSMCPAAADGCELSSRWAATHLAARRGLAADRDANGGEFGHVGHARPSEDLSEVVDGVVGQRYTVEERMTLDVIVRRNGEIATRTWRSTGPRRKQPEAMPESSPDHGRPLSRWGCDCRLCHAHRLDRVRLLGRRPGGVAGG
jgi:hypothetical protein